MAHLLGWFVDSFQWWTAERLTAFSTLATAVIAGVTACIGLKSFTQAKHAETESFRPVMVAQLLPPTSPIDDLQLELSNTGRTTARNLVIQFEPPLPAEIDTDQLNHRSRIESTYSMPPLNLLKRSLLEKTHKTWCPGFTATFPYWVCNVKPNHEFSAEGVSHDTSIVLKYEDSAGFQYEDRYELDPFIWNSKMFQESELEKIRKELQKIAKK